MADSTEYVLYMFPFSLYSLMVRFTTTLGEHAEGTGPTIEKKLVNLHREENFSEWYLTSVNSKGQVPVLQGGGLPSPLSESLEISRWLCQQHFKSLLGAEHESAIDGLLRDLHTISGMSLSVRETLDQFPDGIPIDSVDQRLAREDISTEYRAALEGKKALHEATVRWCIKPEAKLHARKQARELFAAVLELYEKHNQGGAWIFGDSVGATLLDAHIVPLVARLLDTEQEDVIPSALVSYAKTAMASPAYQDASKGRRTLWDISYGHAHMLEL